MFAVFIDEFGHEQPYNPNPVATSYNPVFGYGGFVVPANNLAAFATHFFDLKTYAMRNMLINKQVGEIKANGRPDPRFKERDYLMRLRHEDILKDKKVRRFCAKYEVKGEEIFSRQYIVKQRGILKNGTAGEAAQARRKLRAFYNFMRAFLKLLSQHGAQTIYFGVDKRRYLAKDFQAPHLKFIPEVMQMAFALAQRHNTTASVFIDRHHTDGRENEFGRRPHGRLARSREIILGQGLAERVTEPLVPFHSDESQCIQAADWICYLYSQTFPYLCDKHDWRRYKELYEKVERRLFSEASEVSEFRFISGTSYGRNIQGELPLNAPPQQREFGPRPYYNSAQLPGL